MRRVGWVKSLGLLAILGVGLSGCAVEQPIDNRSMIYAIAIGAAPHHRYHVTADQLNPLSSVTSTIQAPSGSTGPNQIFFSGTSSSVAGAFPHMLANSPGPLDLTNMGVVAFSQAQAKRGVSPIVPFFLQDGHIRLLAWAVVVEGSAKKFLEMVPKTVAGSSFRDVFLAESFAATRHPIVTRTPLWQMYRAVVTPGIGLVLPIVSTKNHMVDFVGSALFHHGKMTGRFSREQTAVYNSLATGRGGMAVSVSLGHGQHAMVRLSNVSGGVRYEHTGRVAITLDARARLTQTPTISGIPTAAMESTINRKVAHRLDSLITSTYQETLRAQCDAFDVGMQVRANQPQLWDRIQKSWPRPLTHMPFSVTVHIAASTQS